ncbi:MAG: Unknown protein [uncultured Sulfurovum sp.]|uniref:Uncharacterized protein n=1 Tax=uncultured Sulfurovum sp. TaxID=269237 RepID=A0A6S6TZX2_9BACT|nr:MAG: Unknown protein [uncultured Sulfurovum sp.]
MENEKNDLFKKLGVDIADGKINIDMNQTKDFFSSLQSLFEGATENIKKDLSEGKVDMGDNVGIKIDKENINIDLEKTKSFIEQLGKTIEGFVGEIDKSVQNISKDLEPKK